MTLRAIAALATGVLFLANPVHAQDSAAMDWTGLYLGLHAGARWREIEPAYFFVGSHSDGNSPAILGAQLGHDWQLGRWVFGLEGDFDAGRQSKTSQTAGKDSVCIDPNSGRFIIPVVAFVCYPTVRTLSRRIDLLADASARFRGGFSWQNWLLYAT